jgi:hypothetical protein
MAIVKHLFERGSIACQHPLAFQLAASFTRGPLIADTSLVIVSGRSRVFSRPGDELARIDCIPALIKVLVHVACTVFERVSRLVAAVHV